MTVGIIACVEVTTTTASTAAGSTPSEVQTVPPGETVPYTVPPSSGTTVTPTSVATTTVCQKDMAIVGGQYVSSVVYSVAPVEGTNNNDLTNPSSNGVTFPEVENFNGVLDSNNNSVYEITITLKESGVDSVGSITLNPSSETNVNEFAVQFFASSNPNQLVAVSAEKPNQPVTLFSKNINSHPTIDNIPSQMPSPLSAIRLLVRSTNDNL